VGTDVKDGHDASDRADRRGVEGDVIKVMASEEERREKSPDRARAPMATPSTRPNAQSTSKGS
jgi:hypothetical protein